MPSAADIHGKVFHEGTATLLARIVGFDGSAIAAADIASVTYSVYLLDDLAPDARNVVVGHAAVSLTPAVVLRDELQVDDIWTVDDTGYNFAHTIDVGDRAAFSVAGARYLVDYRLTPTSGQVVVVRFRLQCI